jgi:hypothetical protein
MRKLLLSVIAALLLATPALAANMTVSGGWFRALPANLPAGGYFTLHNGGVVPISLIGAASPACGMLMLHESVSMNGMSSMESIESIPVPPGTDVTFAPGGYHLMCMKPTAAMKPGGSVPVTLQFADGSKVTSNFAVKNAKGQ